MDARLLLHHSMDVTLYIVMRVFLSLYYIHVECDCDCLDFLTIHMIMNILHSISHFLIKYLLLLNPVQLRLSLLIQQLAVLFIFSFHSNGNYL